MQSSDGCAPYCVEHSPRRWSRALWRRPGTPTAWPMALVDPTRTTRFLRPGRSARVVVMSSCSAARSSGGAGRSAVHRGQHLDVAAGSRQRSARRRCRRRRRGTGRFHKTAQLRVLAGVDPVRRRDHPGPAGLPEDPGRRTDGRELPGSSRSGITSPADRGSRSAHTVRCRARLRNRDRSATSGAPLVLALVGLGVRRARVRQETEKWNVGTGHGFVAWRCGGDLVAGGSHHPRVEGLTKCRGSTRPVSG